MFRKIMLALTIMLFTSFAYAGPFLTANPQGDEVVAHELDFPNSGVTLNVRAAPGGVLMYDLSTWPGEPGWHEGTVKSCGEYSVEDLTSNEITSVSSCSGPAPLRIRIPSNVFQINNLRIQ